MKQLFILYPTIFALCSILLANTPSSHAKPDFDKKPANLERKTQTSDEIGEYIVEYTLSLGDQDFVLETPYLKAGLEQSIKDYLNLQLKCSSVNKITAHSAFHSISIGQIESVAEKRAFVPVMSKCFGSSEECSRELQTSVLAKGAKSSDVKKNYIDNIDTNPCEDFNITTLFDFFEDIFISGLFFNYNNDIETKREDLEDALDLDYNITFLPAKAESLDVVKEVELTLQRIEPTITNCTISQCPTQKSTVLSIFRHFGFNPDESQHECEIVGVNCHENDLVKYIWIENQHKGTTIPDILSELPSLQGLFFVDGEKLGGTIPSSMGKLVALEHLWAPNNLLTGTIPSEIGALRGLRELNFRSNKLRGTIPRHLETLTNLRMLNLGRNFLQGNIPKFGISEIVENFYFSNTPTIFPTSSNAPTISTIAPTKSPTRSPANPINCRMFSEIFGPHLHKQISRYTRKLSSTRKNSHNLISLSLYSNKLTGTVPPEIFNLQNLKHLNLADNLLRSTISSELGQLKNLTVLDLHKNMFQGIVPEEIGNLQEMKLLNFYDNRLTGTMTSKIGNLKKLIELVMDKNRFTGAIPPRIGECSNLQFLSFSENFMKGDFPSEIGNLVQLEHLDFRDYEVEQQPGSKKLTATIPTELGNLLKWKYVILQNNFFRGKIPAEFGNLESTQALWLKGDSVFIEDDRVSQGINAEGVLNISALKYINLNNMTISGTIPPIFGDLTSLIYLSIANNEVTGTIPSELGQLLMLDTFSFANNSLTGTIPTELGLLQDLKVFNIGHNDLTATIPLDMGNMISLRVFDVGNNNLIGQIPSEVGSMTELNTFNLNDNLLSGEIPTEIGLLTVLWELDFSGNNLVGQLPSAIGNMQIIQDFNIGGNQLSGKIPTEIGNLRNLRNFYAAHNQLSGKIPTEMGNLAGILKDIDFGENNLSGIIPIELGRYNFVRDLEILNVGGNDKLSGTIPSGIKNHYEDFFSRKPLQLLNISGTDIIPERFLCNLPQFDPSHSPTLNCRASFISALALPSPFVWITSLIQTFFSSLFCIELRILTDFSGHEISWQITKLDDNTIVMSDAVLKNFKLYRTKTCLPKGCYEFEIYDDWGDGICFPGYYKLFTENKLEFEERRTFCERNWSSQSYIFCSSFDLNPTSSPTISLVPSSSVSSMPSISSHPTTLPADDVFANTFNLPTPDDGSFSEDQDIIDDTKFSSIVVDISEPYIVVGNPLIENRTGEVYIYNIETTHENSLLYNIERSYLQTLRAYDGIDGDGFGRSVSIDNDLIVIGSPAVTILDFDDLEEIHGVGRAYVYHVSGDLFATLIPPDSTWGDGFGWSVGIFEPHIVISAPWNDRGKVYIYSTTLNPVGVPIEIVPNDLGDLGENGSDLFGFSLSISENTVVIGAHSQNDKRGSAYLYNVMGQQIAKLEAHDGRQDDWFGWSVAVDKDTVAVGAIWQNKIFDSDIYGAVYIYDSSGNEVRKLDGLKSNFGCDVDVTNNYIAVRSSNFVFIYDKQGKLLANRLNDWNGDVALSDDTLAVRDVDNDAIVLMKHQI